MGQDYAADFVALDLRRAGASLASEEKRSALAAVRAALPQADLPGRSALLADADPLRFSLAFFELLARGYRPLPLSPSLSPQQVRAAAAASPSACLWLNGHFTAAGGAVEGTSGTYGCFTSGTTSAPKLCVLSVEGAFANARAHAASLGITGDSSVLQCLPLHHSFGLCAYLFTAVAVGCALDFHAVPVTFRQLATRTLVRAALHVSPSQLAFLHREKVPPPPGLETVSVGGGLADAALLSAFRGRMPPSMGVFVTYGLTEAGPRVTTGAVTADYQSGYLGRAIAGVELAVQEAGGALRRQGEGRLCVRTPSRKRNVEAGELAGDFLLTRDQVSLNAAGEVVFRGRAEDLIKVGGVSVYPQDIEAAVRAHPAVRDCIALKQADPVYEEVPVLFVETDETNPALFFDFLKDTLDLAQMPRQIRLMPKFPRHSLDKIHRAELLASLLEVGDA